MPIIGGSIVAGAGVAGSLAGGSKASKGAEKAGKAMADQAGKNLDFAKSTYEQSRTDRLTAYNLASSAAIPSPSELNLIDSMVTNSQNSLSGQLQAVQQGQKILDSISPAVKAAGEQITGMLGGQASALLTPIKAQRDRQRTELQNQLASRIGPGFATTAAGIMALNNFDNDTTNTLTQAQFQSFNQVLSASTSLGSLAGNLASGIASQTGNAYSSSGQLAAQALGGKENIANRQQQAANIYAGFNASPNAAISAGNSLADMVGNQFAGQISQGNNTANLFGNIGGLGAQYAAMKAYGSPSNSGFLSGTSGNGGTLGSQFSIGPTPSNTFSLGANTQL